MLTIDVQRGLMWQESRSLSAPEADHVAQRAGFQFAERFVRKYDGRRVIIGGAGEVLGTRKIPVIDQRGPLGAQRKPKWNWKRIGGLNPHSPKRQSLESIYREQKKVWHPKHPRCEFVDPETGAQCRKRSSQRPHHKKKRGRFLCDTTTWMAVCEHPHHARIHDNEKEAYRHGWLIKTTEAERRGPPIITPRDKIT
jgi:hypothetical protein